MIFRKKLSTRGLKVFFVYTIILAIFATFSIVNFNFLSYKKIGAISVVLNFTVLKTFVVLEFIIISIYLFFNYSRPLIKRILSVFIVAFPLFALITYFTLKITEFDTLPSIIEFLILISFLVYFFYEKMQTVVSYPLYQNISFWISVGLFLYFTGNFFFLVFIYSSDDNNFILQMKYIYSIVTITKNIILSLALFGHEPNEAENNPDTLELPSNLNLDEFSLTNLKNKQ